MRSTGDPCEPRRLGLEVRFDSVPIEGRLYDQANDGVLDRPFLGWLGLMSALEAAGSEGNRPEETL
jgi:hypothetical protein